MGLKPIRFAHGNEFRTEAKMWFQLEDDLWFDCTIMPFRASAANVSWPEPHHLKGHWTCLECPRGLKVVYADEWIDGWMDGWKDRGTGARRIGELFVCPSI